LSSQRIEQRLGLFQVKLEALGEPVVDRRENIVGLLRLALIAPEPRQAPRHTRLPRPGLLRAGSRKRSKESSAFATSGFDVPCGSLDIGLAPSLLAGFRRRQGFINAARAMPSDNSHSAIENTSDPWSVAHIDT
jgi:hypothetical protein